MTDPNTAHSIAELGGQLKALRAENAELVDMLLDATNQGCIQKKIGDEYRSFDGALSTWERILPELVTRGLAEGNEKDGYRLIWPEPTQ